MVNEVRKYHSTCKMVEIVHTAVVMKEYAQVEGVSAGFGVNLESASDLSHGIGVSETAECWEKVQRTSARPHLDLLPGGNGTGTRLT
jgi:hypothetical protein